MHRLLTLMLMVSMPVAAAEPAGSMPVRFQGEWAAGPAYCGSEIDDTAIAIRANRIIYWESDGPIKAVVVNGKNEVALIAELSGEGDTWLATAQFKLSDDGDRLTSISDSGREIVRYRCPQRARVSG